jgi:TrmH family RNA methyltransferase
LTETITSRQNPRLKDLRKLHDRRHRDRAGLFGAEGEDMVAEALRQGAAPEAVFYDADALAAGSPPLDSLPPGVELVPVSGDALASASTLGSGARVIGVWKLRFADLTEVRDQRSEVRDGPAASDLRPPSSALYLHEVRDPGNVGTIVRAAHAFGAAGVVLSPSCADPFGPKAVRAAMGALFAVPVVRGSLDEVRASLGEGWRAVALVPGAGPALRDLGPGVPTLFALGSERAGLPDRIARSCDETAHVPLAPGGAESLNVAMAATLCLYEAAVHRLSD